MEEVKMEHVIQRKRPIIKQLLHICTIFWFNEDQEIIFTNIINFFYSEECSSKSGVNAGTCASGFGVCCTCNAFLKFILFYQLFLLYLFIFSSI